MTQTLKDPTPERFKMKARRQVRDAIKRGDLVRPSACQRCGAADAPCSDGRSYIHAHHHDYALPLDVEWVCAGCHRRETPLPVVMGAPTPGGRNGQARLSASAVQEIRVSSETKAALGARFGVHPKTVQKARSGKYWGHVAAAPQPSGGEK